ncbi:MAG: ComEC/Rec2 family competence protein [Patescibacteria group bacterium]|nr:ComEC/Rec2 family competence protein [Patescibacteria group bacterium]
MKNTILKTKITNARIAILSLLAFVFGVAFVLIWGLPNWLWIVFLGAFIFIAVDNRNKLFICLFFCLIAFGAGGWRAEQSLDRVVSEDLGEFSGDAKVMRGTEDKQEYQRVVISPISGDRFINLKFVAFADHHPKFVVGEFVQVSCNLQKPKNKHDKFNYQRFLAKDGIVQICSNARLQKTGKSDLSWFYKGLLSTEKVLEQRITMLFSQPESDYLAGLLLGGSNRLNGEVAQQFRRTGTTHTVAVSGYNITILASVLMAIAIAIGFWRSQAFWIALAGIIFFVLMIGSPSSAVRAAIMGILVLWAARKGRLASSSNAIIFSAMLMIWHSPLILLYDVGFQLSFLATIGIVVVYGPLAEKMRIKEDFLELKSIVLVTISAQFGVLGILVYNFEAFSPISLLANLIILPLVPLIMLGGFSVVLISFILPPLASAFSWVVWLGLHLEMKAIELLSGISWSLLEIKNVSLLWLVGYYVFFALLVLCLRRHKTIAT